MIIAIFVFIIGACAGSFCSALLHRTRHGGSVVSGRSRCTSCKKELGPIDLIPIVSWIIRRGHCRFCGAKFSWQYLALEVVFGALFVGAYYRYCGWSDFCTSSGALSTARLAAFLVFLGLIFMYDARHGEIPDSYSIVGAVTAFVVNVFIKPEDWLWYILAAAVGAAFFGVQYALSRGRWVGDGDILLGAMIGAMVGWPNVISAIFFAYIIGMVFVVALMAARRKKMTDTIPLGPLLAIGTALVLFFPSEIFRSFWYAFV